MKNQNNFDASISLDTQVKKIKVNDQGDYITIPLGDQGFVKRFYKLVETFEIKQQEYNTVVKNRDLSAKEEIDHLEEMHKAFMDDIDYLFGTGTCQKVFPDMIPDLFLIAELLEQLTPHIKKFVGERNKKINKKYSPTRNGSL